MIKDVYTAWLYAFSPNADNPQFTNYTVQLPQVPGQRVVAQIALSHMAAVAMRGAGAVIKSYTPPFGPEFVFPSDFKYNNVYIENCWAVTFELAATAAEAYAVGTIFIL
jgi:hypothetical protein